MPITNLSFVLIKVARRIYQDTREVKYTSQKYTKQIEIEEAKNSL